MKAEAPSNTAQFQSCVNTVMSHVRLFPIAVCDDCDYDYGGNNNYNSNNNKS